MDPHSTWFTLIDGERHGPHPLSTLQHWAATGALNGEALVSGGPEGPWSPASSLPELELDWQVVDPKGNRFYPCHILALRGEVEEGAIDPFWQVENLLTGETYQVVDALCSALLIQTRILEERLARFRDLNASGDTPSLELIRARDHHQREASRWKRLYEDEMERNRSRETELQKQNDELRSWQRKASDRIKALERRRGQLEEMVTATRSTAPQGGDPDLRNAYAELRVQLDRVLESLELRAEQVDSARMRVLELERELEAERRDRALAREQSETAQQETLRQLTRLEQAHGDLTRSYRNLNDKLIRLRNQPPPPEAGGPAVRPSPPSPTPFPESVSPSPPPSSPPSPGRVKIKLT